MGALPTGSVPEVIRGAARSIAFVVAIRTVAEIIGGATNGITVVIAPSLVAEVVR